jgi:hypothetical protein
LFDACNLKSVGGGPKITPEICSFGPHFFGIWLFVGVILGLGQYVGHEKGQGSDLVDAVFSPHAGPSGAYSPDAGMGYMMDGQAQMMHRAPGDPAFHNEYHYPAQYYGHHL